MPLMEKKLLSTKSAITQIFPKSGTYVQLGNDRNYGIIDWNSFYQRVR